MSEVCPKCGVAVVPGYVKCPKCHAALPRRRPRITVDPGGTALAAKQFPTGAVIGAACVVGVAVVGLLVWHGHGGPAAVAIDAGAQAAAPAAGDPGTDTSSGLVPAPPRAPGPMPADAVASQLEHRLQHLHLWATVELGSTVVDVRSDSCSDPQILPVIAPALPKFKAAGLTRLRCIEESGTIDFTRDF